MRASTTFLKGQTHTFARNDCGACFNMKRCISGSSYSRDPRYYLLSLKGFEPPPTALMRQGSENHEKYSRGIPMLQEYGEERFFADLADCKPIELKEASLCNRLYALRGHFDSLFIQQVTVGHYQIRIKELKSSFQKPYLFQLCAYCLIVSDPSCEIHVLRPNRRDPRKPRILGRKLFREDMPILVDIEAVLAHGFPEPHYFIRQFMYENTITDWGYGISRALLKRTRSLRKYQRLGIYDIKNIPYCHFCKMFKQVDADSDCAFKDLCSPIGYSPQSKSLQTFWGRNKMIIRTKPRIFKQERVE